MKKFFIAFAVFLVWSFFGLWLYSWIQPNKDTANLENKTSNAKVIEPNIQNDSLADPSRVDEVIGNPEISTIEGDFKSKGLRAITSSGVVLFHFKDGIQITKNSADILIPNSNFDFKYKLQTYLLEHPNNEIHITSLYSPSEDVKVPNLGIQRGIKIQELLVDMGISKDNIVVKPFIKELNFNENYIFEESFSFFIKPFDYSRVEALRLAIPKDRIVYPNFTTAGILENAELRLLLAEVIQINADNPDIKFEVIGHTDNVGDSNDNYSMGLEYSQQVRLYLINKAKIDRRNIRALSRGESEPIASNDTREGRIANRRIEMKYMLSHD